MDSDSLHTVFLGHSLMRKSMSSQAKGTSKKHIHCNSFFMNGGGEIQASCVPKKLCFWLTLLGSERKRVQNSSLFRT